MGGWVEGEGVDLFNAKCSPGESRCLRTETPLRQIEESGGGDGGRGVHEGGVVRVGGRGGGTRGRELIPIAMLSPPKRS